MFIDNNLLYTKTEVEAWYKLPTSRFVFRSTNDRIQEALNIDNLLSSATAALGKDTYAHMLAGAVPFDTPGWLEGTLEANREVMGGNVTLESRNYAISEARRINEMQPYTQSCFIGISLGNRVSSVIDGKPDSIGDALKVGRDAMDKMFGQESYPSAAEKKLWRERLEVLHNVMVSGSGGGEPAEPVNEDTLNFLIRRPFGPQLGPDPTCALREHASCVETLVDEGEEPTFTVTSCFARFPQEIRFPEFGPWIAKVFEEDETAWFSARFRLVPAVKVRKMLSNKIKQTLDEAQNAEIAGKYSMDIQERTESATILEHEMSKSTEPWIFGHYTVTQTSDTLKGAKKKASAMRQAFHAQKIELATPPGSQYPLMLQTVPGQKLTVKDYAQYHNLSIIGGGLPAASNAAGD